MISFKLFQERNLRNRLRKKELADLGERDYLNPESIQEWKNAIRFLSDEDFGLPETKKIKKLYDQWRKISAEKAERFLDLEATKFFNSLKRPKSANYKKIYENRGVQVFLDEENVPDKNYAPGSLNYRMVKNSVDTMLWYMKDLMPNKKPKIVITDLKTNPYVSDVYDPKNAALYDAKMIFVDWKYADVPDHYIHEYAHYLADLIPTQTQKLLQDAYREMLNLYFQQTKRKKLDESEISDNIRQRISKKLGFPEYGLLNPDEFFAVLMENWKKLPNNKTTYKFKTLVKSVLTRL